jgi:hypothetical protein
MNTRELTLRHWRIVCLLWFIALTIATHLPQATPSDDPVFVPPDKLLHFIIFGMLAFFFMCTGVVKNPWACWCIIALWALADEVTQDLLPLNRAFSGADLISGEMGIAAVMLWHGALARPSTNKIIESVERTLSTLQNWIAIGILSIGVTLAVLAGLWFALKTITGEQHSQPAFMVAFLAAVICTLWFFVKKGSLQADAKQIIKNMVPTILVTMLIAMMIGVLVSYTTFDPWVAAMTVVVVGLRVSWNRGVRCVRPTT